MVKIKIVVTLIWQISFSTGNGKSRNMHDIIFKERALFIYYFNYLYNKHLMLLQLSLFMITHEFLWAPMLPLI